MITARVQEIEKGLRNAQSLKIDYLTIFQKAPPLEERVRMGLDKQGKFWEPAFGDTPPYAAQSAVLQDLAASFPRAAALAHLDVSVTPEHIETIAISSGTDAPFDLWPDQECLTRAPDAGAIEGDSRPPTNHPRQVR